MVAAVLDYIARDVRPRLRRIILASEFISSVAAAAAVGTLGSLTPLATQKTGDFVGAYLAYGAIAMGFCLGGLTLALTLPSARFTTRLSRVTGSGKLNAYSNLLFVFSWTAIWHWMAVVAWLAIAIYLGWTEPILPPESSTLHRWAIGFAAFAVIYGLSVFLVTLITLSQVGRAYVQQLVDGAPDGPATRSR